jgi:predicted nucleic acid-binding protein
VAKPPCFRSSKLTRLAVAVRQQLICLPIGEEIGERAGSILRHLHKRHGIDIPHAIIAATAEHHGLRLATLNVKHFPMFPKLKRAY